MMGITNDIHGFLKNFPVLEFKILVRCEHSPMKGMAVTSKNARNGKIIPKCARIHRR